MKISILILIFAHFGAGDLNTSWWKHTSIYELIVHTYKDSDGDGIGDFRGVISKLDHLADLGVELIYFTPSMKSPMKDMGYDVLDYYAVNPMYGTMSDFEELVKEIKARDMKLMLDLVINHSSDNHMWFQKSIDKIEPYTNYYVWANASGYDNITSEPLPPNKWERYFGGSAWEWNDKRQQYYYYRFMKEQPDLNLRNQIVKTEIKEILKFWLEKGISGFRLDAPMCYIESEDLNDKYGQLAHEENIAFIHEMRLFLDAYNQEHGGFERIFVPETRMMLPQMIIDYFGTKEYPVTHLPMQYMDLFFYDLPAIIYNIFLQFTLYYLGKDRVSAWVTETHDMSRIKNRMSHESFDILVMMTMALPGSVCLYYGQEIAMENGFTRPDQTRDLFGIESRDPIRLVMQWDDSLNAGFSTNTTTYLPSNSDYYRRNVEMQKNQENSHYNMVKTLLALRKTETLKFGDIKFLMRSPQTFIFWRTYKQYETYIFVANLDHLSSEINIKSVLWNIPEELTVVAASVNSEYKKGDKIRNEFTSKFSMRPLSCILLCWEPSNLN